VTYRSCGDRKVLGVDPLHQGREVLAFEHPLEGNGDLLVAILEAKQAVFEFAERREIIRCQDLPLDDGEVNFNLIQPTGMDRRVNRDQGGPLGAEPIAGLLAAMAGTVVHDPEDAAGRTIRLLVHDLRDQAIKRRDAGFRFTAAKDLGAPHVPSRQISPSASALVFVLDVLGTVRGWGQGRVPTTTGLKAGLLVRAHDEVSASQRCAFPEARVEVENPTGLFDKSRIARKHPAPETPGTKRVAAQPAPQRGAADLGHDAFGQHFAADLGQGKTRQGKTETRREFAGQGLNLNDDAGGKSGPDARPEVPPRVRASAPGRSASATC